MLKKLTSVFAVLAVAAVTVVAAEKTDLKEVKCIVAPNKAVNASKTAEYKDGKVYFCCGGCLGKFKGNEKKFALKANHQLVSTKQYEQKKCPISGGDLNPETAVKVAGTKVAFCCKNCKGKVESAKSDEAKMKIVFNDKSFAKAFKKVEKKKSK